MAPAPQFRRDPPHRGGGLRGPRAAAPPQRPLNSQRNAWSLKWLALFTILLSCAMVLTASLLGPVWSHRLQTRLAERELAELEALENQRLSGKFDEWLDRGHEGLQWTVGALINKRPGVSYFAEQALLRESDSWRIRPRIEAAERIVQIAQELSRVAPRLPAERRSGVRRLVERFAVWPIDDSAQARALTSACDAIIARLPPETTEELLLAEREREDRLLAALVRPTIPVLEAPLPTIIDRDPSELLPPENLPAPESEDPPAPPVKKPVPKRFFAPRASEITPLVIGDPAEAIAPQPEPPQKNLPDWMRGLADLEVMRLLHHGDYGVRYTAEKELDRRGYAAEHLPLAKQLVHPDPRERRKLAEALPRLTNIDPRPWLLQLAEDTDQDVRRTAAGILQAARPGREQR